MVAGDLTLRIVSGVVVAEEVLARRAEAKARAARTLSAQVPVVPARSQVRVAPLLGVQNDPRSSAPLQIGVVLNARIPMVLAQSIRAASDLVASDLVQNRLHAQRHPSARSSTAAVGASHRAKRTRTKRPPIEPSSSLSAGGHACASGLRISRT